MKSLEKEQINCGPVFEKPKNHSREIIIRFIGITIISAISIFVDDVYAHPEVGFLKYFIISFIRTALIWNGSMLIIQYSINRFSMFNETVKLITFQILALTIFVFVVEMGEIFVFENYLKIPLDRSDRITLIVGSLLITFMISSIYASVAFFIQWKANLLRAQSLEKANLEARYETLRNQVNPHFLFNSLNTLLMMVSDNQAASKYVESLSDFMRYMLNTRDKEAVLLRDELKIARQYVFIQQSRFGGKLSVSFEVPESCFHYAIPPLSLQMIIENAIKHNVISKDNPLVVKIFVEDNEYLVIENNISPKIEKEPSTGVGLENIRNRYLYLTGKVVIVKNENGAFIVKLPLFEKEL
jgi:sensor histidine kinase YesM